MAEGPEVKQLRHAETIRERRADAKATPEERQEAQIAAIVARMLPAAVAAELAKINIQGGQGISISGKLPSLTIAATAPVLKFTAVCQGGEIVITGNVS